MADNDLVSVVNNENPIIELEVTSYKNIVDIEFKDSIESVVAVHDSDKNSHTYILSELDLKADLVDMIAALNSKVDKVTGKNLSENDLTNNLKFNYDIAFTNNHIHSNKSLLDNIISSGDGNSFLSNNGTYRAFSQMNVQIGTCSTNSAIAAKDVTLNGFVLSTGATILVKFDNRNTAVTPTLNVNSTGAKSIYNEAGTIVSATSPAYFPAGSIVEFTYDGTNWIFKKRVIENYVNGKSWYRVYSDGWIEQAGQVSAVQNGTNIITFYKSFVNSDYTVLLTINLSTESLGSQSIWVLWQNASSMAIRNFAIPCTENWYVCGY